MYFGYFYVIPLLHKQVAETVCWRAANPWPPTPTIITFFVSISRIPFQRAESAQALAQAAADAQRRVLQRLPRFHADGGTAQAHTGFAAPAATSLSTRRGALCFTYLSSARTDGGNDDRRLVDGELLFYRRLAGLDIVRIDDTDAPDAKGMAQSFQVNFGCGVALDIM